MVKITVTYADGAFADDIFTTMDHPFHVDGKGWTAVEDMGPGDQLITADGTPMLVKSIEAEGYTATTYNLTVANAHTFFVGEERVWVHNQNVDCGDGVDSDGSTTLNPISNPQDLTQHRRNHILDLHRFGSGRRGKTEFPENWSDDRIIHHVSDIATSPNARRGVGKWDSPYAIGTRDGVEIRVDFYPDRLPNGQPHPHAGKISTAYPINAQGNPL